MECGLKWPLVNSQSVTELNKHELSELIPVKVGFWFDKISSHHLLAHSVTKIIFNFFRTYGLPYVITLLQCHIYVYNDVD